MKGTANHSERYENPTFSSLKNYFDFDHSSFYIGYQGATTEICNINCIKPIYIVKCVISGKGYLEITGKKYHIKQNDIFLLPKNVRVTYVADKDDPFSYYYFGIDGINIEKTLNMLGLNEANPVKKFNDPEIPALFEKIFNLLKNYSVSANLEALSFFYRLLFLMSKSDKRNSLSQEKQDIDYINTAILYIKNHYGDDISVQEIAEKLGISRTYFSWLFHKKIGLTPQNYLLRFRIAQACKLINLETSVTLASSLCGFNSPANFSTQFKKIVGITPREFQQRAKDKDTDKSTTELNNYEKLFLNV